MLKSGDLNPRFFKYPSLLIYLNSAVDRVHYLRLQRRSPNDPERLANLDDLEVGRPDYPWLERSRYVSHPSFYIGNRALTALFGIATVFLVWLICIELGERLAALVAAAHLATLPVHIWHSAMITTDVPAACFATLALYCLLRWSRGRCPLGLVAAAGAAGLATTSKYNMGVVFAFVLVGAGVSIATRRSDVRLGMWLALPAIFAFCFLLGTPFAVLEPRAFLSDSLSEVRHYVAEGHGAASVTPGIEHLWRDLRRFAEELGIVPLLLAVGGLAAARRRRGGWLLIGFPLLYTLLVSTTRVDFHRNLLVVYPWLSVGLGLAVTSVASWVRSLPGLARKIASAGLVAGVLLGLGLQSRLAVHQSSVLRSRDSRALAIDSVLEQPKQLVDGMQIWFAAELGFHPRDLVRLEVPFREPTTLEIACRDSPGRMVVAGLAHQAEEGALADEARRLNRIIAASPRPLRSIGEGRTNLERYSVDPALGFWSAEALVVPSDIGCGVFGPLELNPLGTAQVLGDGGLLFPGGAVELRPAEANSGHYELVWRERALDATVTYGVTVFDATGAVLAAAGYEASRHRTERRLLFRVPSPSQIRFRFLPAELPRQTLEPAAGGGTASGVALRRIRIRGVPERRSWP